MNPTSPADPASSPTPHTLTNEAIAMMATAASSRAPITPGGPPDLPPFNGCAGVNEAAQHGGRTGHRGGDDGGHRGGNGEGDLEGDDEGHRGGNDEVHRGGDEDELFDNGVLSDGEFGFDGSVREGAGELDASAAEYSWERRLMHFLRGELITSVTRPLVELVILVEAGIFISGLGPMKNEDKFPKMRAKYISCVLELGLGDFQPRDVRDQMQK